MLSTSQNQSDFSINRIAETIMTSGKIARGQHIRLTNAILSENQITDEERRLINRIFDYIQIGKIKIVDVGTAPKIK
ncbi:MAG: hypothetical protein SXA11_17120 [Cyanobacteriota bacterium]|nr:hypothetical protein [Cyanobacteriota bacterium]